MLLPMPHKYKMTFKHSSTNALGRSDILASLNLRAPSDTQCKKPLGDSESFINTVNVRTFAQQNL